MDRLKALPIALLFLLLGGFGCCFPNRDACLALQDSWQKIRPAAEFGISSNPSLDSDSKATRLRLVEQFGKLIDEMVKAAGGAEDTVEEEPKS